MSKKQSERRELAGGSRVRVKQVLSGAEKRLRRFARRRQTKESKAAYAQAASLVHDLAKKLVLA